MDWMKCPRTIIAHGNGKVRRVSTKPKPDQARLSDIADAVFMLFQPIRAGDDAKSALMPTQSRLSKIESLQQLRIWTSLQVTFHCT